MEEKSKEEPRESGSQDKPLIVRIKPGSANEKSVKAILPESLRSISIERAIQYALEHIATRKDERISERIKAEMTGNYGITANGEPVSGDEGITSYVQEKTSPEGHEYQELEIIVATRQEGGLYRRL